MKRCLAIITGLISLFSTAVNSQNAPVTTAPVIYNPGPSATVSVTVTDFIDIGAVSLTLDYDYSVVQVTAVTANTNFPGFTTDWTTQPGRLVMGWYGLSGITLPDNSILVDITFSGLTSGSTDLVWTDNGESCEYAKYDNGAYTVLNDIPSTYYYRNGYLGYQREGPVTIAPYYPAEANSDICIPITVNGFSDIGAISLTLDYDPAVLEFLSIYSNTIPVTWTFSGEVTDPGRLIAGGFGDGFGTLPDETILFNACFHYNGGTSALTWYDEDEVSCEYADALTLEPLFDDPYGNYYINGLIGPTLTADFEADTLTPPRNFDVHFTDLSNGNPTSWEWIFDRDSDVVFVGGTNDHSQNPVVQFTEGGPYTVTLTVHNSYFTDTRTKEIYIWVGIPGLWEGKVSTEWFTSGNWDDWRIPEITTDVVIPGTGPDFWPVYDGDFNIGIDCKTLVVEPNATITITGDLNIP